MSKKKKILIGIGVLVVVGLIAQALGYGDEPEQPAQEAKQEKTVEPGSEEYIQKNINFVTVAGLWGVEKTEGKELKNNAHTFNAVYYSKDPVKDKDGTEYPISIMVSGTYKAKDNSTGDFYIVLGYQNDEEVKAQKPTILQYLNTTTGDTVSILDPESDVLSQLMQ